MNRRERRKQRITLARAAQSVRHAVAAPPVHNPEPERRPKPVTETQSPAQPHAATAPANRSTGPTSSEGKAVSSRNAVKHGLCSTRLTGADLDQVNELRAVLEDEWEPGTETERLLLQQMAISQWRMNRALALELEMLDQSLEPARLALVLRYRTSAERNFYKALSELQRLRTSIRHERESESGSAPFRAAASSNSPGFTREFVLQDRDALLLSKQFVSQNGSSPSIDRHTYGGNIG